MRSVHSVAAFAAIVSLVAAKPVPSATSGWGPSGTSNASILASALSPPFLNDLARAKGKLWLGTAVDIPGSGEDTDVEYQTILNDTNIFGQLTPANYMKFEYTEPEPNVFNYTGGDIVLELAEDHGKLVRCHNLVWVSQLPEWVTNGNWTNATLTAVMQNHIYNLITHWGDRCYSWDVVNEALNSNGTFASSIWYDTIGPEYFFLAYKFADEAVAATGKDIKLYYNDYGIENPGNKTTAAAALVSELQARGIRIDGVGLESHFEVGATPSQEQQIEAMETFTSLGVEVARTEIDVRFTSLPYNNTGLLVQKQNYYDTIASCMAVDRCIGMTVWDFDDTYSWIPSSFPGEGAADIYNSNFTRKPAYYGIGEAIVGAPCSGCLTSF